MKVQVSIDPETLFLLHGLVMKAKQEIKRSSSNSMIVELFEILAKRCVGYSANPNGKPRSVTIRFHLAEILLECVSASQWSFGPFENNKLEMFKNTLHQKLL